MYLGVLLILFAEAIFFRSAWILLYASMLWLALHSFGRSRGAAVGAAIRGCPALPGAYPSLAPAAAEARLDRAHAAAIEPTGD